MTLRQRVGRVLAWLTYPLTWVVIQYTSRVRILIVAKDEVLLVKNWYGTGSWTLPGGGIESGELPSEAAIRELKEELDLEFKSDQLMSLGQFRQTRTHRYMFYGFVVQLDKKPQLRPAPDEITEARWVPVDDIQKLRPRQHVELLVAAWRKQR